MSDAICIVKGTLVIRELYDSNTRVVFKQRESVFIHYLKCDEISVWDVRLLGTNTDYDCFEAHASELQQALIYLARGIKETWRELHETPDSDLTELDKENKCELLRIVDKIEEDQSIRVCLIG